MFSIDQVRILQTKVMTSMIESFVADPKLYILNDVFGKKEDAGGGEVVEWDEVIGTRYLAKFMAADGPHPNRDLTQVKKRTAKLLTIGETRFLPGAYLLMARNPGTVNDRRMESKVTRELEDMKRCLDRTVEWTCVQALKGSIAIDQSTHATHKVKYTVTIPVDTWTADASWATAGTKILSAAGELTELKEQMVKNAGKEVVRALINEVVSKYFIVNTEVISWVSQNTKDKILRAPHFDNIDGVSFQRYNHGYMTDADVYTKYLPDGYGIFLPADPSTVLFEGDALVPTEQLPGGNGVGGIDVVHGYYAYAEVTKNPVGIRLYAGRRFLPVVKSPKDVIYADLVP